MDTLSTSVSSLKVPTLPSTFSNRELLFYQFKRTPYAITPPHVFSTSTTNQFPKTKPFSQNSSPSLPPLSSPLQPKPKPSSPTFHRNPATGYAAAIIDVAHKTNSLDLVQKDVQRLLNWLQNLNFELGVAEPSVVESVVKQGNIHRHVVAVVKMLAKKNKLGIVKEVLEEFEKIYDELCGTQVVLVSSVTKMGKGELFGIAERVQRLSGARRVKVRNLVQDPNSPSFAV